MFVTTKRLHQHAPTSASAFARQLHPLCFVCSPLNERGMQVDFICLPDGGVQAKVTCLPEYQGYAGLMHGGLMSSLLDAAMTHCLLSQGIYALTAKLEVRYLQPVSVPSELLVRAFLKYSRCPLYELEAVLLHNGMTVANAKAKFIRKS
jgi:acyl-coenzyme A thioesterase PaaI-like protein